MPLYTPEAFHELSRLWITTGWELKYTYGFSWMGRPVIQLPEDMVTVLTHREVANQEIETFKKQKAAQDQRIEMEQAKGTADMQADLARSKVGVNIKKNSAAANKKRQGMNSGYSTAAERQRSWWRTIF